MVRAKRTEEGKKALKFAMEELLNQSETSTLVQSLKGTFDTIDDVLAMTEEQLMALQYEDADGNLNTLRPNQQSVNQIFAHTVFASHFECNIVIVPSNRRTVV